jgi:hypothetical protein
MIGPSDRIASCCSSANAGSPSIDIALARLTAPVRVPDHCASSPCVGNFAFISNALSTQRLPKIDCLDNSSLKDRNCAEGWLYVFGVGAIGGVTLRDQDFALSGRVTSKP